MFDLFAPQEDEKHVVADEDRLRKRSSPRAPELVDLAIEAMTIARPISSSSR